jgi:hypothetical protein
VTHDDLDNIPRIVKNETFFLFARVCMIVASTVGLPIAGFMLSRVVAKADDIEALVRNQGIEIRVISETIKLKDENNSKSVTDHELRIRQLERGK